MSGHGDEFDLYCHGKPLDARERLAPVRQLILDTVPEVSEGRVHFYLVYYFGGGAVAKLHLDARQQVNITFVTGEDLVDPSKLLKGSSSVRTIKVTSDAFLEKNRPSITDLVRQSFALISERFDGSGTFITLRPDQPSP
ncbi:MULTISPECIES: DUF1801 domain-containing protein [unclassified Neorhizobium]|uniref:DUF1801 domain-containing protein n=1 Tax=unclassified Neorhizobium TaxID=2629175 RepID=UPI001FF1B97A|nr:MULTISPECIES: DUF1801 domain-containing protein [unclassified Neorhizobium]MCJ9670057.1 DUF1801 domain-containing protein [Neorhizobium sp. SHOUNA12B]MCJ9746042.1 DUF1801 domain-containing protein [Neorhizobium sp. SHOUNA12A]